MFHDISYDQIAGSQESAILYPMFYRRHGVRRAVQLVAPPLSKLNQLDLPRNSILHFVADDESQYGLAQDDPLLRTQTRLIMVEHMTQLGDDKGPPRPTFLPPNPMIRDYHRKNRQTRLMLRPEIAMRDERTLVMENYAILPHLYRYAATYFASYYKWWNIQTRLWMRMGEMMEYPERQQYLMCHLPQVLPTLGTLKRAETGMTRAVLDRVSDPRSWFIVELWKWLGHNRAESALSKTKPELLRNTNLIWVESGRWFVVNLGLLDDWRKPGKHEDARPDNPGLIDPEQMQRRFLRMLMVLSEVRTVEESPVSQVEVEGSDGRVTAVEETEAATEPDAPIDSTTSQPITIKVKDENEKTRSIKLTSNLDPDRLPDNPIEETDENIQLIDNQISEELEALDRMFEERQRTRASEPAATTDDPAAAESVEEERDPDMVGLSTIAYTTEDRSYEKSLMEKVDALADDGQISAAEYRRFVALSTASQSIDNPYGPGKLVEHAQIAPEELVIDNHPQIPDIVAVDDKSMLKSSLFDFDAKYIEEVMSKDLAAMILNIQHSGVAVTGYSVETHEDATGKFEVHKLQLTPVRGKQSTLEFRLPVVEKDGTFKSNGVRYRLRKQRRDIPIRKVSPSKVALTSYYSKVFVLRSEKQANNYPGWLTNQIAVRGMDDSDQSVVSLMVSNVFDPAVHTPRVYSIIAARFRSFYINDYELFFDYHARKSQYGEDRVIAAEEGGKLIVVGRRHGRLLLMDWNNMIYQLNNDDLVPVGTLETLLELTGRRPIERAEIKVFNKLIPVGVFLGYQLGLTQLMELLKVRPRRVPSGQRVNLADDEYALRFADETLVFTQDGRASTLILAGFQQFDKWIRNYPIGLFDRKDIYLNILEHEKIGMRYLREMDLMVDLFVDPITLDILKELKEPTDFIGLVLRATELLESDWSPAETDMAYQRICGYERMSGAVYQELVKAIRVHRSRGTAGAKIELAPYAVWQVVHQDPAVKVVEESNPVHNLKEMEEVTFAGVGGRGDRSMVANTRIFHESDKGLISEATKDSSQVAITTFLTADPNLTGLRGLTHRYKEGETGPASVLSTSALLAPFSDRDDPKRVNFVSIQQSSGTFAEGYRPSPTRTGYEQILAHRTDDMFAQTAKKAGKVTSVSDKVLVVTYEDGSTEAFELGRRYGTVAALTLPHELLTTLKVGDSFGVGDLLIYNSNYFEIDPLNPKAAVWKAGALVKTAILESTDTLEDSSALSERAAGLMGTYKTEVRQITVRFDQHIHDLVKVGDEVDVESILCTIEDAETAASGLFDETSLDTLRFLAANTPRAKVKGRVERIEVFYHGDLDDMSESLQTLAVTSDRSRRRLAKELGRVYTSGSTDDSMRVEGNPLLLDNAVIKVYITGHVGVASGDKFVFGNQLKTIVGRVWSGEQTTESGVVFDAIFGYLSISNRIVQSPVLMGTTNSLLMTMSRQAAEIYFGK